VVLDWPSAVATEYDPHWAYVRDTLAPDERQHRLLPTGRGRCAGRQGDTLGTPRTVSHVAYFAESGTADGRRPTARGRIHAAVEPDGEGDFALTALRTTRSPRRECTTSAWGVQERSSGTAARTTVGPAPSA
jgi:hypothetical protein